MKKNMIVKSILYAQDVLVYAEKYIEKMDKYYSNEDNKYKDKKSYEEYINFKEECKKGAKERGLI